MDYVKAYEEMGFKPNQNAVTNSKHYGMNGVNFEVFTVLKHMPERLISSTSAANQKTETV